jgi:hypothetical protein
MPTGRNLQLLPLRRTLCNDQWDTPTGATASGGRERGSERERWEKKSDQKYFGDLNLTGRFLIRTDFKYFTFYGSKNIMEE